MATNTNRNDWAVGDGWVPIVEKAVSELVALGMEIAQVKEKFGGLRLYFNYPNPETTQSDVDAADQIVADAEHECSLVCERCGSRDGVETRTPIKGYWIRTLCAVCHRERDEE